jgi:hypothetical protein
MGYTHYWHLERFIEEKAYRTALTECRKIIKASPVRLGDAYGNGKPKLNDGIWINGVGKKSHETFALLRIPNDGDFCKTEHKPYDVIVTACLCVLQEHLGKNACVTSDGDPHEWEKGKKFASKVLKRDVPIPQDVIDQITKYGWWARMYRKEHPEYNYTPLDVSHPNHREENVPEYAKQA